MNIRGFVSAIALGAALATGSPVAAQTAQQGTGQQPVRRIIVFGDSLSDGGFFRTVLPLPPGAGKFTTNPDAVAPEVTAAQLGLPLNSVYGAGGTNFAVGGARVTAANGISIPIATQISNFLNAGGTFGPNDLVYIQGGGNDFFAFQRGGGTDNTILTAAANQLAQQVVRLQAAGAERIVTFAVQTGGAPGLQLFNQSYGAALAAAGVNALYFNTDALFNEIVANAASFGITNVTQTACLGSSSLTCTPATYRTPNANETFLLADSVHPSGITQRIQGQAVASLLKAPEQIGQLSYAAQALIRGQREILEGPMRGTLASGGGGVKLFGNVGYNYFANPGSQQRTGLAERSLTFQVGADIGVGETLGFGVAGAYSKGDGDFRADAGGYDVSAWSANAYGRATFGRLHFGASATYGSLDYDDLTRRLALGPTVRSHSGDTEGDYLAASGSLSFALVEQGGVQLGPDVGLTYEKIELDGYTEGDSLSTAGSFGEQELENLTGRIGLVATTAVGTPVRLVARASYEHEFNDDEQRITITPFGAPISYTSRIFTADDDYFSFAMAVDGQLSAGLNVRAGVRGYVGRSDFDSLTSYAGISLGF